MRGRLRHFSGGLHHVHHRLRYPPFYAGRTRVAGCLQDGCRARPAWLRLGLGTLGHAFQFRDRRASQSVAGKPARPCPGNRYRGMGLRNTCRTAGNPRVARRKRLLLASGSRWVVAQPVAVPSPHRNPSPHARHSITRWVSSPRGGLRLHFSGGLSWAGISLPNRDPT